MTGKIHAAAKNVVNSTILTALARIFMGVGAPIMLAAGAWAITELKMHDVRLARVETEKTELVRRMAEVERRDTDDANRSVSVLSSMAELRAQQAATLRSVERIERVLDAQRVITPR